MGTGVGFKVTPPAPATTRQQPRKKKRHRGNEVDGVDGVRRAHRVTRALPFPRLNAQQRSSGGGFKPRRAADALKELG